MVVKKDWWILHIKWNCTLKSKEIQSTGKSVLKNQGKSYMHSHLTLQWPIQCYTKTRCSEKTRCNVWLYWWKHGTAQAAVIKRLRLPYNDTIVQTSLGKMGFEVMEFIYLEAVVASKYEEDNRLMPDWAKETDV